MSIANWIAIVIGIVAIIGLIGTASYRSNKVIGDLAKEGEGKRGRIYQRIDEMKENNEKKFVDEKVCDVKHESTNRELAQLSTNIGVLSGKIDSLLKKNGIA